MNAHHRFIETRERTINAALYAASDHKERARRELNLARLTKKAGGSLCEIRMYAREARRAWRLAMWFQRKAKNNA